MSIDAIKTSYKNFDLFSPESDRWADREIASRTGDSDVTEEEPGVNGNEELGLPESISMATFAQGKEFQSVLKIVTDMMEAWTAKSEDLTKSQDYRTAHQTMGLAGKKILTAIGEYVIQHQERLLKTSTDERALIGDDAKLLLARLAEPPAPVVTDNRDELIEGALPKFKREELSPEDNARRVREMVSFFESEATKI